MGDKLEFQYRIVTTKAETPGEFWGQESFGETAVALEQTLELRVPVGIYVQVWSPTMKPVESSAATAGTQSPQRIYRWSAPQLKPTVGKEAEAALAAQKKVLWTPEQELDAEQGKLPTVAWTTFKSWEEVGAWHRGLEMDRMVPDETVKAKVAELTKGKTTDEEKAHALYDYVATNIRYLGVAFGIGRYQPHAAAEILNNQYGDCKDKHTLLAAMLAAAGIQSDAVLIGAKVRFNDAVPSPASFNHLITRATIDGKPVWLDTTAEVAAHGADAGGLACGSKQVLVVPTVGGAENGDFNLGDEAAGGMERDSAAGGAHEVRVCDLRHDGTAIENGTVYAKRTISVLAKKVPVSDWRAYKALVDMVNPGKERYIQLVTVPKAPEQRTKQIEDALNSPDPVIKNMATAAEDTRNAGVASGYVTQLAGMGDAGATRLAASRAAMTVETAAAAAETVATAVESDTSQATTASAAGDRASVAV